MLCVVVLAVFLAVVSGQSTDVSPCQYNEGELPLNTYVEGCITPPCQLPQLQDIVVHIVFKSPHTIRKLETLATAYMGSFLVVPVPYPLQENAVTCNFLGNTYCPILEGEVVQYTLRMLIEWFFPVDTQAPIEFRVVDDDKKPIFCLRLPIHIVAPVTEQSIDSKNGTISSANPAVVSVQ